MVGWVSVRLAADGAKADEWRAGGHSGLSEEENFELYAFRLGRLIELERARGSVGFRIGRATRIALRHAAASPWTAPVTWIRTFRGEDEVIESLDPKRK